MNGNSVATDGIQARDLPRHDSVVISRGDNDPLGRVAAPPNKESTSDFFYFWVERGKLVERGQIVLTTSCLGGRTVEFVGLVEEAA